MSATTLGLVIDDPSDIKEISKKIMFFYDTRIQATCGNIVSPRITFMSSELLYIAPKQVGYLVCIS